MWHGPRTPYVHQMRDGRSWGIDSITDLFPLAAFLALIIMALAVIWYVSRRR